MAKSSAAITVAVIIAECVQMTSMLTPTNRNAAMIIGNWRRDHEYMLIVPVNCVKIKI